jgi:FkbM family methyltransferase
MKKKAKKILIKLFNPLAIKLGYVKKKRNQNVCNNINTKGGLLFNFYNILIEMKFIPNHIVDVGANHGTWTREALNYFPNAHYTLFEPQHWLEDSVKDIIKVNKKVTFNPYGVGKSKGSFMFTIVDRDDSCSFKYTKEEAKAKGFEQIEIPVITLNEFIADKDLPTPDIIKIDAEGLDLEVLEGANNYFGKTEIFLVEAAVVNNNIDNTVLKVIDYMDRNGYALFDITDLNRPFSLKVLWLVELVFVIKGGKIDKFIIIK